MELPAYSTDTPSLYSTLIENLPIGIVQNEPDGRIIYYNPRAQEILGYKEEDFSYLNAQDVYVDPADRQELIKNLQDKGFHYYEYRLRRKDGQVIWVKGTSRQILDEKGDVVYLGFLEDVTDHKQMQEAYSRSRQEVSHLSMHLPSIRMTERHQVLQEVKREIGGIFTGLREDLSWLHRVLYDGQQSKREKIESLMRFVELGLHSLERLAQEGGPIILEKGLVPALERIFGGFTSR